MSRLKAKFKRLKSCLKSWNASRKSELKTRKKDLLVCLGLCDVVLEAGQGDDNIRSIRMQSANDLAKMEQEVVNDMAQKTKYKWPIQWDENTKFFHTIINKKWNLRTISGVKLEGNWITDLPQVKTAFFDFFSAKFAKFDTFPVVNQSDRFKSLYPFQREGLETNVSLVEVREAVWSCGSNKSLGPDGFSFALIKHFWEDPKDDILMPLLSFVTLSFFLQAVIDMS
ncbi:uncharacterized protein LOC143624498 [Bidens hawaiensis]|uniref:uncharacterized protein LOC143624498 n=1 Tax=Bidens hawaiensis TaxID=980011 RepID=UPI0040497219